MKLTNQVAIVTGASRGIGRATAKLLAKEGAKVVITYHSDEEAASSIVDEIKQNEGEAIAVQFEAASPKSFEAVVKATLDSFGKIDILVNNAGILDPANIEELDVDRWNKTIAVNLTAYFNNIKLVLPHMEKQNKGKIVNISSIAGIVGSLNSPAYAVSKAGVDGLTKTLSKNIAPHNISINSVAPGPVATEMVKKNMDPKVIEMLKNQTPLGRIAEPEDIAKAVLFFASADSDFITGQVLVVDGGRIVR